METTRSLSFLSWFCTSVSWPTRWLITWKSKGNFTIKTKHPQKKRNMLEKRTSELIHCIQVLISNKDQLSWTLFCNFLHRKDGKRRNVGSTDCLEGQQKTWRTATSYLLTFLLSRPRYQVPRGILLSPCVENLTTFRGTRRSCLVLTLKERSFLRMCCFGELHCFLNTVVSHCYQEGHKSSECPVCSHPLNILGRPLPYAHCAQSRLVCPISGHVMNENNPPMVLPNGYVYGENVSSLKISI